MIGEGDLNFADAKVDALDALDRDDAAEAELAKDERTEPPLGPLEDEMFTWTRALRDVTARPPDVSVSADDLAVIQYTGGTTAAPKGVMLTHAALVANVIQTRHWIPDLRDGREVFLSVLPFSHI
jgi:long-chain acyl-CoA synthetase